MYPSWDTILTLGKTKLSVSQVYIMWHIHLSVRSSLVCFYFVWGTEFLDELESARQQVSSNHGHAQEVQPVLVHCTAGVGRTGVIILTDLMIGCLQSNQRVNILKSLIHLRSQRMLLVANFGQYRFVYTVLIHFLKNSRLI